MRDRRWISWVLVAAGSIVALYELVVYLQGARPESLAIFARILGYSFIVGGLLIAAILVATYLLMLLAIRFSEPLDDETREEIKRRLQ